MGPVDSENMAKSKTTGPASGRPRWGGLKQGIFRFIALLPLGLLLMILAGLVIRVAQIRA